MDEEAAESGLPELHKHTKDKKVTGSIQHGFTKEKSCLTKLTAFYKTNGSVYERSGGCCLF